MPENEFELALQKRPEPAVTGVQAMTGRYMQEVQGMVFMAKQYPRDQYAAWQRIKEACSRKSLAEKAQYLYPRGGEAISGPSIRLAEVLAQAWGNISFGVIELEQRPGASTAMAYAWDLETNTRSEMIFEVKHERKTKKGTNKLTDARDIYELVANYGARRKRACILAVIPSDVVDNATKECDKTLQGTNKGPISDRIKAMLDRFQEFGVTKEMIEKWAGFSLDKFVEKNVLDLGKIYNSLKDGMAKREDFFEIEGATLSQPSAEDEKLQEEFRKDQEAKKKADAGKGKPEQMGLQTEREPGEEG